MINGVNNESVNGLNKKLQEFEEKIKFERQTNEKLEAKLMYLINFHFSLSLFLLFSSP